MKENKNKLVGIICVALSAIIWGSTGIFTEHLNDAGLSFKEVTTVRAFFAVVITGLFLLLTNPRQLKLHLRDLWCFLGTGILNMLCCSLCTFAGIRQVGLAVMGVLVYSGPVFVTLWGLLFFHERMTLQRAVALVLAVLGCCLVSGLGSDLGTLTGVGLLYGLGAGLAYSMYALFSKKATQRGYSSTTITFYSFVFAFLGSLLLSDVPLIVTTAVEVPSIVLWYVGIAFVDAFLGYVLYTKGLQLVDGSTVAILSSGQPLTAVFLGVVFFHEPLTALMGVGIVLVILAILMLSRSYLPKKKQA